MIFGVVDEQARLKDHTCTGRQVVEEKSFDIQIYKDLVFCLLLVGLIRRGLISSLNSVA